MSQQAGANGRPDPNAFMQRKRGLFGVPSMVPGMGDVQAPDRMPTMAAEQPQEGKRKTNWAGVISDFLGGMVGQPARFAMAQQEQRQFEQQVHAREQLAQAQRAAEMQDWRAKFDYERANPKPINNDTVADYEFIAGKLGPEAAQTYLQNRADPPQFRQGPDGQFYRVSPPPSRPVGKLTPIDGGPTPPASGGFPR